MEIRSKMCITNTRERNTIGEMLLLKKIIIIKKPTNKKPKNFWTVFALYKQSN